MNNPMPAVFHVEGEKWGQLRGAGVQKINGNAVLNPDGTYAIEQNLNYGSVLPDYTGGFFNQFSYKNWKLSISVDYQEGGKYFSMSDFWGSYSGLYAKTAATNDNGKNVRDDVSAGGGVHVLGVLANGKPYDTYVDAYTYYHQFAQDGGGFSNSVFDASYLKVREISLGYNFPVSKWHWKYVKKAFVSFVARNPWLIYASNRNFDPSELSQLNGEYGQLPGTRGYGLNIKLGF
jgi:hypothetical protein